MLECNWKKIAELYFPQRNANQLKCKFAYLNSKCERKREVVYKEARTISCTPMSLSLKAEV